MPGETGLKLDLTEFTQKLNAFARVSNQEAGRFAEHVSLAIFSQAQKRAPKKTNFLAQDSAIPPRVIDGTSGLGWEFGFGAYYAAAVHERSELHHDNGQSHYMLAAINEDGPGIMQRAVPLMAQRLAGRVGS